MPSDKKGQPCVLIIAPHGSYRTFAFIQAAENLGINTLIASEGKHSVISAYAEGIHVDFTSPESVYDELEKAIKGYDIRGVVATDDYTTELAAKIARLLDLPHNIPEAVKLTQRKDLARDCLEKYRVNKPNHLRIDLKLELKPQLSNIKFPVVVKPISLSASKGVIRANNEVEAFEAVQRIEKLLQSMNDIGTDAKRYLLIEEFISGPEVAVEGMLQHGQLHLLTIFDKPDPLDGPYFEETYYTMPTVLDRAMQDKIIQLLQEACMAYGLTEGPIHAECRIHNGEVYLLEMAARTIGGLCAKLLSVGTGYSLEELVLAHAMDAPLEIKPAEQAAGVLMIPIPKAGVLKRIEGLLEAQALPFIDEINIQIREGHELIPLPEGSSYLGFIFAYAGNAVQVEQALREAHAKLKFVVSPIWKLQQAG